MAAISIALVYIIRPLRPRSSGLDYVGLVDEIASRRGCGVNGGLTVIFFLGCMKSEKDILNMQSRRWSVATICRSGLLVYALLSRPMRVCPLKRF